MKRSRRRIWSVLLAALLLAAVGGTAGAAEPQARTDREPVVVAFGDSITASGSWFSAAEKQFGISIQNKAVGGWNSKDGLAAFAGAMTAKPDLLLLSFGMNDAALDMAKYVPLETYTQNMRTMIERAQASGATVILVIENPIGAEQYYTRHDKTVFEPYGGVEPFYLQYVQAARALAAEYRLIFMDLYEVFSAQEDYNRFLADGVHPNAKGYALYAAELCKALVRLELGDVNGDGEVNARDYLLLKRSILGISDLGDRKPYADLNQDGEVNARDYILLKRRLLQNRER